MTAIVTLGAVSLDGTYRQADGVLQVGPRFFEDWYSMAEAKTDIEERPTADGAFDVDRELWSSLPLQMDGWFRGDTWLSAMTELSAQVSSGLPLLVTVTDDLGVTSRWVTVRRFRPRPNPGARLFEFSLIMLARDPRRYGPEVDASTGLPTSGTGLVFPVVFPIDWGTPGDEGRATLTNTGHAESWPVLEVTGELANGVELVEVETGAVLRLDRVIPSGSTVVFDARRGRAYLDTPSNDLTGFMTKREWWPVPAGQSRTVQMNALGAHSGSPTLTFRLAPAY